MAFAATADAKNPTSATPVELFAAGATGEKILIQFLYATNRGSTNVNLLVKDGTTTRWTICLLVGASFFFQSTPGKPFLYPAGLATAATAVNVALSASGDVLVSAEASLQGGTPT